MGPTMEQAIWAFRSSLDTACDAGKLRDATNAIPIHPRSNGKLEAKFLNYDKIRNILQKFWKFRTLVKIGTSLLYEDVQKDSHADPAAARARLLFRSSHDYNYEKKVI